MDSKFNEIAGQLTHYSTDDYSSDETIILEKSDYDSDDSLWTESPKRKPSFVEKQTLNSSDKRIFRDRYRRLRIRSVSDRLRDLVPNITDKTDFATLLETTADYLLHLSKCHKNKCEDFLPLMSRKIVSNSSRRVRKRAKLVKQIKTEHVLDSSSGRSLVIDVNPDLVQDIQSDLDLETVGIERNASEEQIETVVNELHTNCAQIDPSLQVIIVNTSETLPQMTCEVEINNNKDKSNTLEVKPKRKPKFVPKYKK